MKRILVGVDGSEAAAAALRWAGRFAHAVGSEVVVASAFEPHQAELPPERYDALEDEAERRLETEWSAPLDGSGAQHRSLLLRGAPDGLLQAVEDEDADMLVVGPRGHSRFSQLHIGSVTHHLAHYTRRPLAIVPTPGADAMFDRMVVGVDGSEGSKYAVQWCTEVALATGAQVIAVHVLEPLVEWVPESYPRSWRRHTERAIHDSWTAPLRDAGVSVQVHIVDRIHPVAALVDVIDKEAAGLVVLGTRGIGGFLNLKLGRVPIQLVHHTQLPTVLVPAPADRLVLTAEAASDDEAIEA